MEVSGIGCLGEHEEWFRKKFADSHIEIYSPVVRLVQHKLGRLLVCCPGPLAVHPTIEASLVNVN